jgi:hypothetical protein
MQKKSPLYGTFYLAQQYIVPFAATPSWISVAVFAVFNEVFEV